MRWLIIIPIAICLLVGVARADDWYITKYNTDITVHADGTITIVETIHADFAEPHHGIFRLIRLRYQDRIGRRFAYAFHLCSVTDGHGRSYPVIHTTQGDYDNVKIGDPDQLTTGPHEYEITYTVDRGIRFIEHRPELYWNAIGQEWSAPIRTATCTVHLPQAAKLGTDDYYARTGPQGSTEGDARIDTHDSKDLTFTATRELGPQEGMTIWIGLPEGAIAEPQRNQRAIWFLGDNGMWGIPIVFLIGFVVLWKRRGKDPGAGRSATVTYEPPDHLIPAEMGVIIDERAGLREISSTIIDLAVRGYIKIEVLHEEGFLVDKTDYCLTKLKDVDANLTPFEMHLLDDVFGSESSQHISYLRNSFWVHLPALRLRLYDQLVAKGYFAQSPDRIRSEYCVLAAVLIVGAVFAESFTQSMMWFGAIAACGVIGLLFAPAMPRKTLKGTRALQEIIGFEDYLRTAERGEIEAQARQGDFEKYLPYAMELNVADQWAHAFQGIANQPPQWYIGPMGSGFNPGFFAHDMTAAASQMGSSLASSPGSSGGGGGGFSGGGGGGGGGGAW